VRLANSIRTYDGYREAYGQGGTAAVFGTHDGEMTDERARRIIDRTWELSLELLNRRGLGAARPLLRLLACFADAPIPYESLLDPDVLAGTESLAGMNSRRLRELLVALAGVSLIELDTYGAASAGRPPSVRLHALVRATGRDLLDASGQTAEFLRLALSLIGRAATAAGDPEEPAHWSTWYALLPHATQIFREVATTDLGPEAFPDAASVALRAARHLRSGGLYPAAQRACLEIAEACNAQLGPEHPVTLAARVQLAELAGATGDPEQAAKSLSALLPPLVIARGASHADTLAARAALARWTGEAGDAAAALQLLTELVPLYTAAFGEEHVKTLRVRINLASAIPDGGVARDRFTELVTIYEQVRGLDHPDTLRARANLAEATGTTGDPVAARDQLAAVADGYQRVYGPDHPQTLRTLAAHVRWMANAGATQAARGALTALRPRMVEVFGEAHPETVRLDAELGFLEAALPPRRWSAGRSAPAPILVTGARGAGKTSLLATWLRGDAAPDVVSTGAEFFRLVGGPQVIGRQSLMVVPGPESDQKYAVLERATGPGRSPGGVIHVVCWGFNTRWGLERMMIEDPTLTTAQRREGDRQDELTWEVEEFRRICERLAEAWTRPGAPNRGRWLVVAVAKTDLYWHQLDQALNYYAGDRAASPFAEALDDLTQRVKPLPVAVVPVSAGNGPDSARRQELLAGLSSTVDDLRHGRIRTKHLRAADHVSHRFWA